MGLEFNMKCQTLHNPRSPHSPKEKSPNIPTNQSRPLTKRNAHLTSSQAGARNNVKFAAVMKSDQHQTQPLPPLPPPPPPRSPSPRRPQNDQRPLSQAKQKNDSVKCIMGYRLNPPGLWTWTTADISGFGSLSINIFFLFIH